MVISSNQSEHNAKVAVRHPVSQAVARALRRTHRLALPAVGAMALGAVVALAPFSMSGPVEAHAGNTLSQGTGPASFANIVEHSRESVVAIVTRSASSEGALSRAMPPQMRDKLPPGHPFRRFFGPAPGNGERPAVRGVGSGFVVDGEGLIVTNNHVIEDAQNITVVLHDGSEIEAKVRGVDSKTDLALLEVKTDKPLRALRFADSDAARVGDWVMAVGSPFGLGGSYTAGIISARGRDINSGPYDDFLQIDASINRGNSGGALLNSHGEVIGVNTAIFSPNGGNVGIGFAVPAKLAQAIIQDLHDDGIVERGWLGVRIQALSPELAESLALPAPTGALIAGVAPQSPAAAGGLQTGDVILSVNATKVEQMRDLPRLVASLELGDKHTFKVWRDGSNVTLTFKVGQAPADEVASNTDTGALGLQLAPLTEAVRSRFGVDGERDGIAIVGVERGGYAARAGLRPGMVIEQIQRKPAKGPGDLLNAVRDARAAAAKGDPHAILLLVSEADGGRRFFALTVG
jgi:serine protease Do